MLIWIRNSIAQRPLSIVAGFVVATLVCIGLAACAYTDRRATAGELAELRDHQGGCPIGTWRVGEAPNGGRFCIDPVKWGELQGQRQGRTETFEAIRNGETSCPPVRN